MTPSWTLRAWPPVLWQAESTPQLRLFHLGTCVLSEDEEKTAGQTIWGTTETDVDAGVAWDWITTKPSGVVAMADPMTVVTNLQLLGRCGEVLTALEAVIYLTGMVHSVPWQHEVQRAMSQH
jgi:hypothetical protein